MSILASDNSISELALRNKIESKIIMLRGKKMMLDRNLAKLYGVGTRRLNEQVKRNMKRFPNDFMFQITEEENKNLMSQIATSSFHGGYRKLSYAFTEQGISMLSSVLNSDRAIKVNIQIMRTFVRLREILLAHKDLAIKLTDLEKKYDTKFRVVFDAIRKLMDRTPVPPQRRIGFMAEKPEKRSV